MQTIVSASISICHYLFNFAPTSHLQNIGQTHHARWRHSYNVIMGAIASQITSLTIVYSTVYSDVDQRKHQSSASLAFVWEFTGRPVNSPHKWPVTRKMFPFDDVIMLISQHEQVIISIINCAMELLVHFQNFNVATLEGREWTSNFVAHFIMDVITYSCWD